VKEIFEFFLFRFINALKYKEELEIGFSISCDKKIIPERSQLASSTDIPSGER
jgi:hypothetical protein